MSSKIKGRKVCYEVCSPISPDSRGRGSWRQRDRHCTICATPSRTRTHASHSARGGNPTDGATATTESPLHTAYLTGATARARKTPGTITPPPAPIELSIAPNLADTIDNTYLAVEPWVRYGFQVAADVLAWVPFVGWLSGQIMVFYNFFESKVQSAVFNFTDWLEGRAASSRMWSTSASTSFGFSSTWVSTSGITSCRTCRPCRFRRDRR